MNFEEWLKYNNYRSTTIKKTLWQLERAAGYIAGGHPHLPGSTMGGLKRWLAYLDSEKPRLNAASKRLQTEVRKRVAESKEVRIKRKTRKLEAHSLSDEDMAELSEHLDQDETPEGCALNAIVTTGLRVGDVLRLSRVDLKKGLRAGILAVETKGGDFTSIPIAGSKPAWEKLYDGMHNYSTVAKYVCPAGDGSPEAGGAAYQRLNRYLKEQAVRLELSGRIHLHKLRRSFAKAALQESGGNIVAVQQALGHRSIVSTQHYLNELQLDNVAELQRNIKAKRQKGKVK